jgi:integrase
VARLIEAAPGPKYKAALGVAYGAGLRVSGVANLRVSDIDSERMVIRVEQGKGRKDHNAKLSPRLSRVPTARAFLLWRLSDDGPRCSWHRPQWAVIRNPCMGLLLSSRKQRCC